jgi:hypothetical protein
MKLEKYYSKPYLFKENLAKKNCGKCEKWIWPVNIKIIWFSHNFHKLQKKQRKLTVQKSEKF